ncbi:metallophosphoesterase family protein [Niveispirillum sp.]|uniref:metallophosphoesterase family protein n=1 Tax=Niveispirillum sp. TaxID=1917217 RepID=UPI001B62A8AB|nr:metallophosphoesterase family protein [Niveispirillum sp.]MBP7335860.1 metallophosphoesterase family protein [Niveispirillum sp.]
MRIAVISDVHGNLGALTAVLADIDRRGVDQVVDLGDKLSGPLFPAETADLMMDREIVHIAGNHERQLLELPVERMGMSDRIAHAALTPRHRDWLSSLPAQRALADGDIWLCHGIPGSDRTYFLEEVGTWGCRPADPALVAARAGTVEASVILCGHSHLQRAVRLSDGRLVVNPGSVGLQAYRDDHLFLHQNEMGSPHARYCVLERARGTWAVTMVELAYDWDAAADLAASRGADGWVQALRTGRVG